MSGQRSLAPFWRASRNPIRAPKELGGTKSFVAYANSMPGTRASSRRTKLTRAHARPPQPQQRSLRVKIEYSEEAAADLSEATGWYGSFRVGFDEEFLSAVVRAELLIGEHPFGAPTWPDIPDDARIRRALIPGFPNALAYRLEGERILIVAVVSLRMEPGYWLRRVRS